MKRAIAWLMISVFALAACGRDDPAESAVPTEVEPEAVAQSLLARVDADSPYVFGNLERMPEDLVSRLWAANEAFQDPDDDTLEKIADREGLPPLVRALIREFAGISSRSDWEARGLNSNPLVSLHAISVFPVLHYELGDAGAFAATLKRIETEAGEPFPGREVAGEPVIWVPIADTVGLAIHHDDQFLTLALVPEHADTLARVVGAAGPENALGVDPIRALNRQYGFASYGSGYVDWGRLTERWLDEADERLDPLRARTDLSEIAAHPACQSEYRAVTRALPRLVVGATRFDSGSIESVVRQEVSTDLGSRLAPIADTPVTLDRELNGLASLGVSANLLAARDFARQLVAGWVDHPPECPAFAHFAENAPQWQVALNQPIPPVVTNLQGAFVELERLEITADGVPAGGGALAIFMRNPQLLVGMAQMFSPAVAELELKPGGGPKRVPAGLVPQLEGLDLEAFLAMSENALGLAVGEDNLELLSRLLAGGAGDQNLVAVNINYARLHELLAMDAAGVPENEAPGTHMERQRAQLERLGEVYDKTGFRLKLTEAGIDFLVGISFKED